MLILITYDINTEDAKGKKRLNAIAKCCVKYGQRVQNSVFECIVDAAQFKLIQHKLVLLMNKDKDSIRFYNLGKNYETKIEHFGVKVSYEPEGTLIL